jgi:hypothetical protein
MTRKNTQSTQRPAVEEHYSPAEIAERIGLHVNQVRALFQPGKIWPVVRLNARVIRVPASTVQRYLDAHTWEPKPIIVAAATD